MTAQLAAIAQNPASLGVRGVPGSKNVIGVPDCGCESRAILDRMSLTRRVLLSLAVVAAMASAACGDPPEKELQQAQGAIDTARAAGADQYAREEFTAAEEALKRAHDAVAQRDYRQALNSALDARERAQTATKESVNQKATARAEAERALAAAEAALNDARAKLKAAETARASAKTLAATRQAVSAEESAVQKARTAFQTGDYLASIDLASQASTRLHGAARDLALPTPTTGRRRR